MVMDPHILFGLVAIFTAICLLALLSLACMVLWRHLSTAPTAVRFDELFPDQRSRLARLFNPYRRGASGTLYNVRTGEEVDETSEVGLPQYDRPPNYSSTLLPASHVPSPPLDPISENPCDPVVVPVPVVATSSSSAGASLAAAASQEGTTDMQSSIAPQVLTKVTVTSLPPSRSSSPVSTTTTTTATTTSHPLPRPRSPGCA